MLCTLHLIKKKPHQSQISALSSTSVTQSCFLGLAWGRFQFFDFFKIDLYFSYLDVAYQMDDTWEGVKKVQSSRRRPSGKINFSIHYALGKHSLLHSWRSSLASKTGQGKKFTTRSLSFWIPHFLRLCAPVQEIFFFCSRTSHKTTSAA